MTPHNLCSYIYIATESEKKMDSQDVSVAIATGHLPFLVWLLSGVICSLTKTFIEKFDDNKKSTTAATKTTTLGPVKNIFVVFLQMLRSSASKHLCIFYEFVSHFSPSSYFSG